MFEKQVPPLRLLEWRVFQSLWLSQALTTWPLPKDVASAPLVKDEACFVPAGLSSAVAAV